MKSKLFISARTVSAERFSPSSRGIVKNMFSTLRTLKGGFSRGKCVSADRRNTCQIFSWELSRLSFIEIGV